MLESTRTIQLSTDTIKNNIAAFLVATRTVSDADDITNIEFGDLKKDQVSITVKLNGREVKANNDEHFQIT